MGQISKPVLLVILGVVGCARLAVGATVEETLATLNSKPAEERQRLLIENAKKEGSVNFYAATNLRDTQEIV
ncbi:MAG TPA: hypothetical protein VEI95_07145, partial [Acidobacteriota bacterium]|nr:hypothetical protein [Acidobacteriota bacterium]